MKKNALSQISRISQINRNFNIKYLICYSGFKYFEDLIYI